MNSWKNDLKRAFEAHQPEMERKRSFIKEYSSCFHEPVMPARQFIIVQVGYIGKWTWCVSALVFAVAVLGLAVVPEKVLCLISGLTPLLALTVISESGRSQRYEMAELELTTRFSLKSITLARLLILGVFNLMVLILLLYMGVYSSAINSMAVCLYIVTPFMLTTFTGLFISRRARGQEMMYISVAAAVIISFCVLMSYEVTAVIYDSGNVKWWAAAAAVLVIGNGRECSKMMKGTEELRWNLL